MKYKIHGDSLMFEKNNKKGKVDSDSPSNSNEPNFSHSALGSFQDPVTQRWQLVEFKFDPTTGATKVHEKTEMSDGRMELNERFKIKAAEVIAHFKY